MNTFLGVLWFGTMLLVFFFGANSKSYQEEIQSIPGNSKSWRIAKRIFHYSWCSSVLLFAIEVANLMVVISDTSSSLSREPNFPISKLVFPLFLLSGSVTIIGSAIASKSKKQHRKEEEK